MPEQPQPAEFEKITTGETAKILWESKEKDKTITNFMANFGARAVLGKDFREVLANDPKKAKIITAYLLFALSLNEIVDREEQLKSIDRKRWLWELHDRYRQHALQLDKLIETPEQRTAISQAMDDIWQTENDILSRGVENVSLEEAFRYREIVNGAHIAVTSALMIDRPETYQHFNQEQLDDRYKWLEEPENEQEEGASALYYLSMAAQVVDDWNHKVADSRHFLVTPALVAEHSPEIEAPRSVNSRVALANKLLYYCSKLDKYLSKPAIATAMSVYDSAMKGFELSTILHRKNAMERHSLVRGIFGIGPIPNELKVSALKHPLTNPADDHFVNGEYDARTPEEIIRGEPPRNDTSKPEEPE